MKASDECQLAPIPFTTSDTWFFSLITFYCEGSNSDSSHDHKHRAPYILIYLQQLAASAEQSVVPSFKGGRESPI